jgi:CBS domain-containing protein
MHHKTVQDVMAKRPRTIEPSTALMEAARLMRDEDVGSLPIVEGDRLTGILTDRDIAVRAVAEGRDPESTTARDVASRELVTVDPQQPLEEAARLMAEHQVRRLPVCEEDGRLVGMLAQADVAKHGGEDARTGQMVEDISRS